MAKNYFDYTDKGHREVERRIDNGINSHFKFLRKDIIHKKWLDKEEVDMYINSLLSDNNCKQEITEGYEMKDIEDDEIIFDFEKKQKPSFWLSEKTNNIQEMEKISNIRKWFLNQKKGRSYKKSEKFINKTEYEDKYKTNIKNFDTRDVTLNNIIEFAIRDLIEGCLTDFLKENSVDGLNGFRIIKTNEYDDVCAKTDFIIELSYSNRKEYEAYDLTTSNSEENLQRKKSLKKVFCPNFHFNEQIKQAIPRSLIVLSDKEFVFKYIRKYMQQIQLTGDIKPNDALNLINNIGYNTKEVKNNILEQLLDNISKN